MNPALSASFSMASWPDSGFEAPASEVREEEIYGEPLSAMHSYQATMISADEIRLYFNSERIPL